MSSVLVLMSSVVLGCMSAEPRPAPEPLEEPHPELVRAGDEALGQLRREESPDTSEDVATTCDALTRRDVCMGICTYLAGLGCTAVTEVCAAAEVLTVGSVSVPCGIAMVAACVGGPGAVLACGVKLCPG